MSKTATQKLEQKRATWLERTCRIFGSDAQTAQELLSQKRKQSIRLNPLIAAPDQTLGRLRQLGWQGSAYTWAPNCYSVESDLSTLRDSKLVRSGAVYIQNAASWLPVLALSPTPGQKILDVCAAPGGKASHIAALTHDQAALTVNDNSRARLAKMRANLERLGVQAEYTLFDATRLARKLGSAQFGQVLLDTPCSGEGLMTYDRDKDFATWSVAHIQRLQSLQKQIILQAWQLLQPGGTLVYSTCTMAPEENEAVIDYLLRKRPDASVQPLVYDLPNRVAPLLEWNGRSFRPEVADCLRLAPSAHIEAFFVCKLHKLADSDNTLYSYE